MLKNFIRDRNRVYPNIQEETPVEILQNSMEFYAVLELFNQDKPMDILEIGVNFGGTLYHWLKNAPKYSVVTTVDLSYDKGRRHMFEEWAADSKVGRLNLIEGDSTSKKTVDEVAGWAPYDWIFIDADHYFGSIRSDWINYSEMAAKSGIIVIHDIVSRPEVPWIEVDRMWKIIRKQGYITQEIIDDSGANVDMGIGIVYL